jgi:hypothetical protein
MLAVTMTLLTAWIEGEKSEPGQDIAAGGE